MTVPFVHRACTAISLHRCLLVIPVPLVCRASAFPDTYVESGNLAKSGGIISCHAALAKRVATIKTEARTFLIRPLSLWNQKQLPRRHQMCAHSASVCGLGWIRCATPRQQRIRGQFEGCKGIMFSSGMNLPGIGGQQFVGLPLHQIRRLQVAPKLLPEIQLTNATPPPPRTPRPQGEIAEPQEHCFALGTGTLSETESCAYVPRCGPTVWLASRRRSRPPALLCRYEKAFREPVACDPCLRFHCRAGLGAGNVITLRATRPQGTGSQLRVLTPHLGYLQLELGT